VTGSFGAAAPGVTGFFGAAAPGVTGSFGAAAPGVTGSFGAAAAAAGSGTAPLVPLTLEAARALPHGTRVVLLEAYATRPPCVAAGAVGTTTGVSSAGNVEVNFLGRAGACPPPHHLAVAPPEGSPPLASASAGSAAPSAGGPPLSLEAARALPSGTRVVLLEAYTRTLPHVAAGAVGTLLGRPAGGFPQFGDGVRVQFEGSSLVAVPGARQLALAVAAHAGFGHAPAPGVTGTFAAAAGVQGNDEAVLVARLQNAPSGAGGVHRSGG
jgi:hypothetical protein